MAPTSTRAAILALLAFLPALLFGSACTCVKRFGYEGFGRDAWQQPERVIASLELAPGDRVADLGAGGGYFTFRLAESVGPEGRVYAADVDDEMLAYLEKRARDEGYDQVETVRSALDDPELPEPVDLIFTCNTYHHLQDRVAYFRNAARYLRPGGRIAIVELDGHGWFARWFPHWTDPQEIRDELAAAGYVLEADPDFLERQSFLVFARGEG